VTRTLSDFYKSANVQDGSAVRADLKLSAEVCVIGSGAGGAVAACTLAAAGKDVLVVEEGALQTNADFDMQEAHVYPRLYQEQMQRATEDLGISILQGRSVGGGTVVNWTTCFRTPEDVLAHWKTRHSVAGFTLQDLVPHYEWIEKRLAIKQVQPGEPNANNRKLLEGCEKLHWTYELLQRNVHACMQSGACGLGCPYNAKRSALVSTLPDAIAAGARLIHRARIERMVTRAGAVVAAEGVLLDAGTQTPTGVRITIEAKRFVLAGGAINTPALLLRSGIDDDGRVGARTFLHPVIGQAADYEEIIAPYDGAPQSVASHHFAKRDPEVGIFLEAAPMHPLLASTSFSGRGALHEEAMKRLPHIATHIGLTIDGFHDDVPGGRVKLRASGAPVLDYPIPSRIWSALRFAQKRLAEIAFASGAKRVFSLHEPTFQMLSPADIAKLDDLPWRTGSVAVFSAHQMGGCAMGNDDKTSIVRCEDLRHHRLKNLYVMDGSIFPTSLGVNPQLSIYGLVRLMATRLSALS
jgi:choline dehydrogenase-like flavoprotein